MNVYVVNIRSNMAINFQIKSRRPNSYLTRKTILTPIVQKLQLPRFFHPHPYFKSAAPTFIAFITHYDE